MSALNWAALAVAVITIVTGFTGAIRWLVKHYLAELKPNGGSSMRDEFNNRITRLEARVETIISLLER
jgi:hypothetical protein